MEPEELAEIPEKAHGAGQRRIGVTMAVFAALLAVVTLMSHRLHTEEVVMQTKLADQWAFYQARNTRAQMYAADARLAELQGGAPLAEEWSQKAGEERKQADEIRRDNEQLDRETQLTARRASLYDAAEVFLEIAIVLCSIALLTGTMAFWQSSFVATAIAVVVGGYATVI
jgi:hypothetical protein